MIFSIFANWFVYFLHETHKIRFKLLPSLIFYYMLLISIHQLFTWMTSNNTFSYKKLSLILVKLALSNQPFTDPIIFSLYLQKYKVNYFLINLLLLSLLINIYTNQHLIIITLRKDLCKTQTLINSVTYGDTNILIAESRNSSNKKSTATITVLSMM